MKNKPRASGVREVKGCRICGSSRLDEFFNLGNQPLANSFLKREELNDEEQVYPLRVILCSKCNLVQLGDVVEPRLLFPKDYIYSSSGMPASEHFRSYAESVVKDFVEKPEDLVVEIGSNDGHFLSVVKETHAKVLGVDPAEKLAKIAAARGVPTLPDFFDEEIGGKVRGEYGPAKVIVANNVVAHIDDHQSLVKGVEKMLAPDGVFIVEAPYLMDMFENLTFDTIYHEHLSYLALRPLRVLFDQYGLEIFDVKLLPIQGNSFRIFVGRKEVRGKQPIVEELMAKEVAMKLDRFDAYLNLVENIKKLRNDVLSVLTDLKAKGKRIAGYGAPAKGNTLLNYFGIGPNHLEYATEALPGKVGLYTPGMHIPVVDIRWARESLPDYFLMLAWNYKDKILKKEEGFRRRGGKFIIPVGHERIV